MQTEFPPNTTT